MSKERLELLKRSKEWIEATGEKFYTVDKEDYEWLIRQLEKFVEESHSLVFEVNELEKENKRYREAINQFFYSYINENIEDPQVVIEIVESFRKALEGEE